MPTGTPLRNMFTDKDIVAIRRMVRGGRTLYHVADHWGICQTSIHRIVTGEAFPHLPGAMVKDRGIEARRDVVISEEGKAYAHSLLTDDDVRWARKRAGEGRTLSWLAKQLEVSESVARAAVCGRTYSHIIDAPPRPPKNDGRGYSDTALTPRLVMEIRRRHAENDVPKRQLAREYKVSARHIRDIIARRVWQAVP